jgi:NAD(P)-dependent dehydrogenase (short-subunit alcohol dehydrogenase family)
MATEDVRERPGWLSSVFDVEDLVVIVTGASSGIGLRMATTLARAGATVCAVARRADRLQELAAAEERVVPLVADVADAEGRSELVRHVLDTYGRVDVLVNNAGTSNIAKIADESVADLRRVLEVNLVAPFDLSKLAGAAMIDQPQGGSIINVASIVGLVGLGRMPQAAYASSKGALVNLTRELAAQWARKGVRVNAIAPGWFPTELTEDLFQEESGRNWVRGLTPMGRPGELHELDGLLLLLASRASSYMTGTVIPVDGGWTAV